MMEMDTHESVAPALAGLAVGDDDGLLDVAVDGEVLPQRLVGGVVGQSADEQLGPRRVLLLDGRRAGAGVGGRRRHAAGERGHGGGRERCLRGHLLGHGGGRRARGGAGAGADHRVGGPAEHGGGASWHQHPVGVNGAGVRGFGGHESDSGAVEQRAGGDDVDETIRADSEGKRHGTLSARSGGAAACCCLLLLSSMLALAGVCVCLFACCER
jgi:hypothetical protein